MSRQRIITGVDIGTDTCTTLIATIDDQTNQLKVVGTSVVASRGLKRSTIVDLEQVLETVTESLDAAERMAGFEVKSAFVSLSGPHITSQNSKGVVAVAAPNQEIVRDDVARVIEAARAISLPSDREIIHIVPRDFKVDSQDGIKDPVGMTGVRLEAEAHIITSLSVSLRNLEKCFHDLGLSIDGFVFSGLAASEVVVSETEKELGVVSVDIGAGSTSICAYVDGSLAFSAALPIGARHITQDIALGCRISLDSAEKIKVALAGELDIPLKPHAGESKEEFNKRRKRADQLDVSSLGIDEKTEILSKRTLIEGIMVPRMKEIFTMVGLQLQKHDLMELVPAGIVLSGGGAETVGIAEVAKRVLNVPTRIAKPLHLMGLIADVEKAAFATPIGLLEFGRKQGGGAVENASFNWGGLMGGDKANVLFTKIINFIKSLTP